MRLCFMPGGDGIKDLTHQRPGIPPWIAGTKPGNDEGEDGNV